MFPTTELTRLFIYSVALQQTHTTLTHQNLIFKYYLGEFVSHIGRISGRLRPGRYARPARLTLTLGLLDLKRGAGRNVGSVFKPPLMFVKCNTLKLVNRSGVRLVGNVHDYACRRILFHFLSCRVNLSAFST